MRKYTYALNFEGNKLMEKVKIGLKKSSRDFGFLSLYVERDNPNFYVFDSKEPYYKINETLKDYFSKLKNNLEFKLIDLNKDPKNNLNIIKEKELIILF